MKHFVSITIALDVWTGKNGDKIIGQRKYNEPIGKHTFYIKANGELYNQVYEKGKITKCPVKDNSEIWFKDILIDFDLT